MRIRPLVLGLLSLLLAAVIATTGWLLTALVDSTKPLSLGVESTFSLDYVEPKTSLAEELESDYAPTVIRNSLVSLAEQNGYSIYRLTGTDDASGTSHEVFIPLEQNYPAPERIPRLNRPDALSQASSELGSLDYHGDYVLVPKATGGNANHFYESARNDGLRLSEKTQFLHLIQSVVFRLPALVAILFLFVVSLFALVFVLRVSGLRLAALRTINGGHRSQKGNWRQWAFVILPHLVLIGLASTFLARQGSYSFAFLFLRFYAAGIGLALATTGLAVAVTAPLLRRAVALLGQRAPAEKAAGKALKVISVFTCVTFVAAGLSSAAALRSYQQESEAQQTWKSLAEFGALHFSANFDGPAGRAEGGELLPPSVQQNFRDFALSWEREHGAVLSHTLPKEGTGVPDSCPVALANRQWHDLQDYQFRPGDDNHSVDYSAAQEHFAASVDLWAQESGDLLLKSAQIGPVSADHAVGFISGTMSGELVPGDCFYVLETDDLSGFDADFLSSTASSENLLFADFSELGPELTAAGLEGYVYPVRAADRGLAELVASTALFWLNILSVLGALLATLAALIVQTRIQLRVHRRLLVLLHSAGQSPDKTMWRLFKSQLVSLTVVVILSVLAPLLLPNPFLYTFTALSCLVLIVYLGFARLSISQHMSASPRSHNVIG